MPSIAEVTGDCSSIKNKIPLHVSIDALYATKNEVKLTQIVEDFAKEEKANVIRFIHRNL